MCALAPTIEILIIGRLVQGLAAGIQMPQVRDAPLGSSADLGCQLPRLVAAYGAEVLDLRRAEELLAGAEMPRLFASSSEPIEGAQSSTA